MGLGFGNVESSVTLRGFRDLGEQSLIGVGSREKERRIRNKVKTTFSGSFIARRGQKMEYII